MRFLHAADIHLDSPRAGLDREADAPADEIQRAPRRALENLVQLALDERVDFVLIAGDLYDGDWKDYRTGLFFVQQMSRLRDAGIPVFLIAGNHDAANKMTRSLRLPENVTLFDPKRPHTERIEALDVAVHGQSFAKQAVHEDLSAGYPAKVAGWFNIGLLHTCAENTDEKASGHPAYAPCTPQGLQKKGYDYWALGHIHKRQELRVEGPGKIHFPGNVQGRHINEEGAKGCLLVSVTGDGTAAAEFVPLDVFRWARVPVIATGADRADDVVERFAGELRRATAAAEGRPLAVRVDISGACRAHEQLAADPQKWQTEFKSVAAQAGSGQVWVEKIVRRTALPREVDEALLLEGPVGELVEYIRELQRDDALLSDLLQEADELRALESRLPGALTEGPEPLVLTSPERTRGLLDDVRQILAQRLLRAADVADES